MGTVIHKKDLPRCMEYFEEISQKIDNVIHCAKNKGPFEVQEISKAVIYRMENAKELIDDILSGLNNWQSFH